MRGFFGLGGNFVRAVPDRGRIEPAWRRMRLTVQVATKLNRSHLIHGEVTYILPCLGRIERDWQASGRQAVTMEDSTACIHGSLGLHPPAGPQLRSEPAIIAGVAKATLPSNPRIDWDAWVGNYALVRDAIAETYPDIFRDFNERMWQPGGFHRDLPARHRQWKTKTGKANFVTPRSLDEDADMASSDRDVLKLITLRSNDQFNTTVYGYNDRFRGIHGTRTVVLMNRNDIDRLRLQEGDEVTLVTEAPDGVDRRLRGLSVVAYDIPEGCCGGYYPECNVLVPVWHHAERAKVPAAKAVPVRILRQGGAGPKRSASSDLVSGNLLGDVASDLARAVEVGAELGLRQLRRSPAKAALAMGAAGLALWAVLAARRRIGEAGRPGGRDR